MGLLGTKSRLEQLREKTEGALGIFENTLTNLVNTNKQIRQEQALTSEKISRLQLERSGLKELEQSNEAVIEKISDFLGLSTTEKED